MSASPRHRSDAAPRRLHLGCGDLAAPGWLNVDYFIGARLARVPGLARLLRALGIFHLSWSPRIRIHDLRRPFPWPVAWADAVYSSHTLEHLGRVEGLHFLRECHRVLRPEGVLRVVVPDLRAIVRAYEKGEIAAIDLLERLCVFAERPGDGRLKRLLAPHVRFPHRCMYDAEALLARLEEVGFAARLEAPFVSRIPGIEEVEREDRVEGALIAEGVKLPRAMA